MIQSYFNRVRSKLKEISPLIKTDYVSIEMVSADMGILRGKISFVDGSVLDFREIFSTKEHDYRFQWMNTTNKLMIRWDTAPHYKSLNNFPFHKHIEKDVSSSEELNFIDVLEYIKKDLIMRLFKDKR